MIKCSIDIIRCFFGTIPICLKIRFAKNIRHFYRVVTIEVTAYLFIFKLHIGKSIYRIGYIKELLPAMIIRIIDFKIAISITSSACGHQ
ncbi:hypothetical protein D3C78_1589970 [compost metagenome]